MSGEFRRSKRLPRRIIFEDGPFAGLEMRITGFTVGEWLDWTVGDMVDAFCERLISWNWVDDDTGEPVPPDRAAILTIDAADLRTLMALWREKVTGLHPDPLGTARDRASTNGVLEATIPMGPPPTET